MTDKGELWPTKEEEETEFKNFKLNKKIENYSKNKK